MKKQDNKSIFKRNGKIISGSEYLDNNRTVKIYMKGEILFLTTNFGLTVRWDGYHKADIIVCDEYAGFVCGLCGNADGIKYSIFQVN